MSRAIIQYGDGDGASASLTGNPAYDYHAYDAYFSQYQITAHAVTDGGTYDATYNVSVTNLPPEVCISGADSVSEGSTYTLNLSASDPGGDGPLTYYVQWGDGASQTLHDSPGLIGHIYADNSSYGYSLQVTVTDAYGASAYASRTVVVNDVPPTLGASGPSTIPEGSSYPLDLCWHDPGADTLAFSINWGDGSDTQTVSGDTSRVYHRFRTPSGQCSCVSISASDEDGTYTFNGSQISVGVGPASSSASGGGYYQITGDGYTCVTSLPSDVQISGSLKLRSDYDTNDDGVTEVYINHGGPADTTCCSLTNTTSVNSPADAPWYPCAWTCFSVSSGDMTFNSAAGTWTVPVHLYATNGSQQWGLRTYNFSASLLSVSVYASDDSASEVGPDTGTFTANISGPISSDSPTLCVYYTMSGTATPTADYTMSASSFTFTPGGSTSATATLTPDGKSPEDKTAIMGLGVPTTVAAGAATTAEAVIAGLPLPVVSVVATQSDASEDNCRPAKFTFTRTGSTYGDLAVYYSLSGSAVPGVGNGGGTYSPDTADYTGAGAAANGRYSITILDGSPSADLTLTPTNDFLFEGDESIVVEIAAAPMGPPLYAAAGGPAQANLASLNVTDLRLASLSNNGQLLQDKDANAPTVQQIIAQLSLMGDDPNPRVRDRAEAQLQSYASDYPTKVIPYLRSVLAILGPEARARVSRVLHRLGIWASVALVANQNAIIVSFQSDRTIPDGQSDLNRFEVDCDDARLKSAQGASIEWVGGAGWIFQQGGAYTVEIEPLKAGQFKILTIHSSSEHWDNDVNRWVEDPNSRSSQTYFITFR